VQNVTITATSLNSQTAPLTVNPPPSITTASVPSPWTQGVAYPATALTATGGTGTPTWALAPGSGPLPTGLALSAAGVLSGNPSAPGAYSFTVRVTDAVGGTADKSFSVTINAPLAITTTSLPVGTVGVAYAATVTATGGAGSYTWSANGLPSWLTLNASTGALTATPVMQGAYTFFVQVTDSGTPTPQTTSKLFNITVAAGLVVATSALPGGAVGVAYNQTLVASGGTPPYVWMLVSGAVPPGLSLGASTGSLAGVPTTLGSYTFTVQVRDAASATAMREFLLNIASALTITTSSTLAPGTMGTLYTAVLVASGGAPPYVWSVSSGSVSPGLNLEPGTGILSGTPSSAGTFQFTVTLTDSTAATTSKAFSINIVSTLTITTPAQLTSGVVGTPYSLALAASGGRTPYTWSVTTGALSPGLSLNAATGVISGTPTTAGSYSFLLQVTDGAGSSANKLVTLAITATLAITSPAQLPGGVVGAAYSQTLTATGGTAPYTWSIVSGAGQLPAGLTLNASTGALTGAPTASGTFNFTVQVTDNASQKATLAATLTIAAGFSITSESLLPAGTVGASYSQTLAAAGGSPPYSEWKVTAGILPAGLSLDPSTGRIAGTPTAVGTLTFTVQVRDSAAGTASKSFTLTINALPLAITTASPLPAGVLGGAYSQTLQASGGVAPYSWVVKDGALPAGLTLEAASGRLSGTPAAMDTASFTLEVTDSARKTAAKAFTLAIGPPPLPAVQITGPPATADPLQQPTVRLALTSAYALPITGELTLSFAPDAVHSADDPAIQFSPGGRKVSFTVAANATEATFSGGSLGLQTGTVAGTITLSAAFRADGRDVTPSPAPTQVVRVLRSAPFIRSLEVVKTGAGFDVYVRGYSTPRQVTQATFRFAAASGGNLQTSELTLQMTQLADPWFGGQESAQYGSQFTLRQSFTVNGDIRAIGSVSLTLSNSVGSSQTVSAGL